MCTNCYSCIPWIVPGPCNDYEYQQADKTIDIFVLVYTWNRLPQWFSLLLLASLVFRFQKSKDAKTLIRFPDYFRELTIVGILFPGNMWAILAVLVFKPFVEIYLHDRK